MLSTMDNNLLSLILLSRPPHHLSPKPKMSVTRFGTIYSKFDNTNKQKKNETYRRPAFFEPTPFYESKSKRSNRTQFNAETLRELCGESDNDSTSTYNSDSDKEYSPRYEANIDFNLASEAWRANKYRVGESWKYRKNAFCSDTSTSTSTIASRIKDRRRRASIKK